jgi:hypothetical protein
LVWIYAVLGPSREIIGTETMAENKENMYTRVQYKVLFEDCAEAFLGRRQVSFPSVLLNILCGNDLNCKGHITEVMKLSFVSD